MSQDHETRASYTTLAARSFQQQRHEPRAKVDWGCMYEKLPDVHQQFQILEQAYDHIRSNDSSQDGVCHVGVVSDVSVNGCQVAGEPLPLNSRVTFMMDIPGLRPVPAIGWVIWRRRHDVRVTSECGEKVLPKGFAVIFEWIESQTRQEILRRATNST